MSADQNLAHELDRVMRKLDAQMHKLMPAVDTGRIGPMGGLLLMQLETLQPCNIQTLATTMGRDNSQLTRLTRDLERKGVIMRSPDPTDARATLLSVTPAGQRFLKQARKVLNDVVQTTAADLTKEEVGKLVSLLRRL